MISSVLLGFVLLLAISNCALLQFDSTWHSSTLEELTERSIYQSLALIHPHDRIVRQAARDTSPVGAYARHILRLRSFFHTASPRLKLSLKRIFERPEQPPLSEALAGAQDRLYGRLMMLTTPGPTRAALIKYAVYRRQGIHLGELQSQLKNDPEWRRLNTEPAQPFMLHKKFSAALRAFEQDVVDAGVMAAEAIGNEQLKRMYIDLALSQLDAHITIAQADHSRNSNAQRQNNEPHREEWNQRSRSIVL